MRKLLLVAACALIDADGRVLMSQRPPGKTHAGLWEFPGGKIEAGERPEQAVVRELREELGIDPCERCLEPFLFASHAYDNFDLLMPLYLCRQWDGFVKPSEGQNVKWLFAEAIPSLILVPADIPLARALSERLPRGRRFVG